MKIKLFLILSLLAFQFVQAQEKPEPAEKILKDAFTQAQKENKIVFIIFHASWCGWCHKMDTAMQDKGCADLFNKSFVIKHLVILESKGKENLNNPGAVDLLKKYKGDDSGIPFWLIFDSKGLLLADSKMRPEGAGLDAKGSNMGCPAAPEEVVYFIKVLKKTTSLNEKELAVIAERFNKIRGH
jgi:hypothetical protein